jgi:hypothetical protein
VVWGCLLVILREIYPAGEVKMGKFLVLVFENDALTEDLTGVQGMAPYAKATVDAYKAEPGYLGYGISTVETEAEAIAAVRAKLGLS